MLQTIRRDALPSTSKPDVRRVRLQLGCGQTRPDGWINVDSSLNSFLQGVPIVSGVLKRMTRTSYERRAEFMEVRRTWPLASASVDIVYASHLFEHLSRTSARDFLREAHRVLKPRGVLRLVVPDLFALARNYVKAVESGDAQASESFLYAMNLHQEQTYAAGRSLLVKMINSLQNYPHQHKYMYDACSLRDAIAAGGFAELREAGYGQSFYISEIADVECTAEGQPSIYVEARRV